MNPRVTLMLAVLVAALGAFVWFWEVEGADRRTEAEAAEKRIFPATLATDLTAFELTTTDGRELRLEKEDSWRIVKPISFPADSGAADGLVSALAGLRREAVYDDPEPLANYGLEGEPTVRAFAGEQAVELMIGNASPSGSNTYVAIPGDPRVQTVPTFALNAMRKNLDDFRESRVLDFDQSSLQSIDVAWQGSRVALSTGAEGEGAWQLTHPLAAPADVMTVGRLLSDLSFLRAEAYVDEPSEEQLASLREPAMKIVLNGAEGADPIELRVSAENDSGRRTLRGREGLVYEIGSDRFDALPQTAFAFRFKELTGFTDADVAAFELEFLDGDGVYRVSAEKQPDGSYVTEPDGFVPGTAEPLVAAMAGLEAIGILAETLGPDELAGIGLDPATAKVRVFGQGEQGARATLAEISLGAIRPKRGVAAKRAGDPVVYWLDEGLAERVPVSLEAFRNRFVAKMETPEAGDALLEGLDEVSAGEDEPVAAPDASAE